MKLPTSNILKYYFFAALIFISLGLLLGISNLTGEQDAVAAKVSKDISKVEFSTREEADLIEHLDELESMDLMENMDMLKNMDIIEKIDTSESAKKG